MGAVAKIFGGSSKPAPVYIPTPTPIPVREAEVEPESARVREEEARKLRAKHGAAKNMLSSPLGTLGSVESLGNSLLGRGGGA